MNHQNPTWTCDHEGCRRPGIPYADQFCGGCGGARTAAEPDVSKGDANADGQPAQGGLPKVGETVEARTRNGKLTLKDVTFVQSDFCGEPAFFVGTGVDRWGPFFEFEEGDFWRRVPQPQPAAETIPLVASAKVKGDPDMLYIDAGCDSYLVRCKPASRAAAIAKLLTEATMPAVATKEEP